MLHDFKHRICSEHTLNKHLYIMVTVSVIQIICTGNLYWQLHFCFLIDLLLSHFIVFPCQCRVFVLALWTCTIFGFVYMYNCLITVIGIQYCCAVLPHTIFSVLDGIRSKSKLFSRIWSLHTCLINVCRILAIATFYIHVYISF